MSPTNSSPSIAYKTLQTFQNCVVYLAQRPMITELEADTFSTEDAANVQISCALSAIAYELLPNFKAILKSQGARQQKIKLFDVLTLVARKAPTFLVTGDRFKESVEPVISDAIAKLMPGDMMTVILVKAQSNLLNAMDFSLKGMEQSSEGVDSLLEMVQGLKTVLVKKVDAQIVTHAGSVDTKIEL